jgi:hypothetical protein
MLVSTLPRGVMRARTVCVTGSWVRRSSGKLLDHRVDLADQFDSDLA